MAVNLRMDPSISAAVKVEAARTGRSQQQIIRMAIEKYLASASSPVPPSAVPAITVPSGTIPSGTTPSGTDPSSAGQLPHNAATMLSTGLLLPARKAWTRPARRIRLPEGTESLDLLDREDRL